MDQPNYTLGRGELYFNKFAPGTKSGIGERYFGNTPSIDFNVQANMLDHYSSDAGVNEKDMSIATQTNRTGTFATDNIDPESLALWWFGSASALTVAAATAQSETLKAVKLGYFYQLGASAANPMGDQLVANVVVKDDQTTPKTYVAGTDYNVNTDLGRIEPLVGGTIVDGVTNLVVTYDVAASSRELVISGDTPIEGSLRYIAQNPQGDNMDYFFPYVKITPNGAFALKADNAWQSIPFTLEILKLTGYEAMYSSKRAVAG